MLWQEMWYLGLDNIVASFFSNPEWVALRAKGRSTSAADLYGAEMCKKINNTSGGRLFRPESSGWIIGYDNVQIFNHVQHSTGVLLGR